MIRATLLGLLVIAQVSGRGEDPREFTTERGPIRRELVRFADASKEEADTFERRMHRYSWAISDAVSEQRVGRPFGRRELLALTITVGGFESHYDRDVCENFEAKTPALGCWQTEMDPAPESVEEAARRAVRDLARAWRYCAAEGQPSARCALSIYATGSDLDWPGATRRVAVYESVLGRLR